MAINQKCRAAAARCLVAGMPLLVVDGNHSAELGVDDVQSSLDIEQAKIGRDRIYQIANLPPIP